MQPAPDTARPLRRRIRRIVAGMLLVPAVAAFLLQIPPVRTSLVSRVIRAAAPWDDMEVRIRATHGSVLWSLGVEDFSLVRTDGSEAIRIDSVGITWSPAGLFGRRLVLDEVDVVRPTVHARRDSVGVIDLVAPFLDRPDEPADWTVAIGRLDLRQGTVSLWTDSVAAWVAGEVRIALRDLSTGSGLGLRLDSLRAYVSDPGSTLPGEIRARASLGDGVAVFDTLLFRTERSTVTGSGTLRMPGEGVPPTDSLHFRFEASPLALADLSPLLPTLNPEGEIRLAVDVRGTGRTLWVGALGGTGDGGVLSVETSGLVDPDSVAWSGAAEFRSISPASLLAGWPDGESVSGMAEFRVAGPSYDRLHGSTRADLAASNLAGFDAVAVDLGMDWRDGRAETRVDASVDGSDVRIAGWIEPLSDVPAYDLTIRTGRLEWNGSVPLSGSIQGSLRGRGVDLDAEADLSWRTEGARVGGCALEGRGGTVTLRQGQLDAKAELLHCGAPVRLDAVLDLAGTRPWTLRRLALDDVPVAPGDSVSGRVTAELSGSGTLDPGSGPFGSIRITGGAIAWGGVAADSIRSTATFGRSQWTLAVAARVGAGTASGRAEGDASGIRTATADFREVDLSRIPDSGLPSSSLSGRVSGTVDWTDRAAVSATLQADLDRSRIADQFIDSLHVEAGMRGGLGTATTVATLRGGRFQAGASFGLATDSAWARVDGARFEGIDVAAWTGTALNTDLSGSASGSFLTHAGRPSGRMALTVDRGSLVRGATLGGATVEAHLRPDSTVVSLDARLEGGGGARARFSVAPDTSYRLSIRLDSLDAARLALSDTVSSRVSGEIGIHGRGFDPGTAEARLVADLRGAVGPIGGVAVTAAAGLRAGLVSLDRFRADGRFGTIQAGGAVPLPGTRIDGSTDLTVSAELGDAGPLARLAGLEAFTLSTGTVRARIRGSSRGLTVSATTAAGGLVARRVHVADLAAALSAEIDPEWSLRAAEVRVDASTLSLPSTTAETAGLVATIRPDTVSVEGDIRFTELRQARATAVITDSLRSVSILSFRALLDGAEWALLSPVDLSLDDGFELSGAVLQADGQRIAAGGGLGSGSGNLYVTAENVRLDAVASLLGFRGLGMTVGGALTGSGTVDQPRLNGTLETAVTVNGRPSATVVLATAFADRLLQVDAGVRNASGGSGTVQGSLSLEGEGLADTPVNLDVVADSLALAWFLPFMDRELISDIGGRLSGRIEVRGTFQEPVLSGRATLRNGRLGLPTLGRPRSPLVMTQVAGDLAFEGSRIHVERASARSGPGTLSATGVVNLEQLTLGRFALDVRSSDFLAIDDAAYRAFADSDLRLTGTTRRPALSGSVRIGRGDFYMTDDKAAAALEPVELDAGDLLALEQRFGIRVTARDTTQVTFYDALTIEELRLDFERDVWYRSRANPRMDVRFTGSLDVRKTPRSEPVVFGTIRVVPEQSRIEQFGRRFDIERGELSFSGEMMAPQIDLAATYEVRAKGASREEVTIRLVATGEPQDLRIDFESDPAMDLSDIISYIATGRPASSSLRFEGSGDGYLNTAAGLAMGPIAGVIEDVAGAGLGLDVVEIEHDGLSGLTLTAGKYVSPEFYVAVRQPISFASGAEATSSEQVARTQVSMEYEVLRELLVSLLSRGSVLRVQLSWEHAF